MKIFYSPYELKAKSPLNALTSELSQKGALLKFVFPQGTIGYADCHPWVELGDHSLQKQLELLANGVFTPLTRKSLAFAKRDADFSKRNKNIFEDQILPKNRYTCIDKPGFENLTKIKNSGFEFIKFKFGKNFEEESEYLLNALYFCERISLSPQIDFNHSLSRDQLYQFLDKVTPYLPIVDCLEDPIPYEEVEWKKLKDKFGVKLALDHGAQYDHLNKSDIDYIILKPSKHEVSFHEYNNDNSTKIIFSSYMDHPLGQLCAMEEAISFTNQFPDLVAPYTAFLTHHCFENNEYSNLLKVEETKLIPPKEVGFGFHSILQNEAWETLSSC